MEHSGQLQQQRAWLVPQEIKGYGRLNRVGKNLMLVLTYTANALVLSSCQNQD